MWVETIDSGRHSSLEIAPRGSIFKSQGRKESDPRGSLTPSKVTSLRTTYIQQIKELHSLKEFGAITDDHLNCETEIYSLTTWTKLQ